MKLLPEPPRETTSLPCEEGQHDSCPGEWNVNNVRRVEPDHDVERLIAKRQLSLPISTEVRSELA